MCRVGHRGSGICYCLKYLSLLFLSACYDEIRTLTLNSSELQVRQSDSKFVIPNFSSSTSSSSTSSWDKLLPQRLDWNVEGPACTRSGSSSGWNYFNLYVFLASARNPKYLGSNLPKSFYEMFTRKSFCYVFVLYLLLTWQAVQQRLMII